MRLPDPGHPPEGAQEAAAHGGRQVLKYCHRFRVLKLSSKTYSNLKFFHQGLALAGRSRLEGRGQGLQALPQAGGREPVRQREGRAGAARGAGRHPAPAEEGAGPGLQELRHSYVQVLEDWPRGVQRCPQDPAPQGPAGRGGAGQEEQSCSPGNNSVQATVTAQPQVQSLHPTVTVRLAQSPGANPSTALHTAGQAAG